MEAYGVVRCRGSHIIQTIGSQMSVSLSDLHADCSLPPEIFGTHFYYRLSKPLSHGAAERINCTEKNISDPVGSRTHDLPACSIALQPSMLQLMRKLSMLCSNTNSNEILLSWTFTLTFQIGLPFLPLRYTYITPTSLPRFTSLYLTLLHFIAPHLTSLHCFSWWFPPNFDFTDVSLSNLFLNLLGLQEGVPKASAGSWFQSCMVLFTKKYFLISALCFHSKFSYHDQLCSDSMAFVIYHL
jgi:hypothetical protein